MKSFFLTMKRRFAACIFLASSLVFTALPLQATDQTQTSDIHKAAREGDLERVKTILSTEKNLLNSQDSIGETPLSLSASYARWDIFKYLLEAGAEVNIITRIKTTPLHCVCRHDRPDMVELLFDRGSAPSMKVKDIFGEYTPMLRAVQRGNKKVISLLFEKGASPKEATKEGWNALHLAAKCGHRHLYGLLIEKGVSLDAKDKDGRKPMEYDFKRPDPIPMNPNQYKEYAGYYSWQGKPKNPGVDIFIQEGDLILDDNGFNTIYPIAKDTFYCQKNPWKIKFHRNDEGKVDQVELIFLRRNVILNRVK